MIIENAFKNRFFFGQLFPLGIYYFHNVTPFNFRPLIFPQFHTCEYKDGKSWRVVRPLACRKETYHFRFDASK